MMFSKLFFNRKDAKNYAKVAKGSPRKLLRPSRHLCRSAVAVFAVKLFTLCVFAVSFNKHEYHASVTNMQYDPKERVFEVSVRMFTDDLEKTLTRENGGQRVIFDKKYENNNDLLLEKYVRKHFALQTAQKQRKAFNYVGHETEADAQWVYLELPYSEPFRGVNLQQSVLLDMFDDQVNLVTINYNTQKKTLLFRKNQTVQEINW